jgi:hypothetical protein
MTKLKQVDWFSGRREVGSMKKFSLRHNYTTIDLVGPLEHLKISLDYGHVNHQAVYSEAYWLMRFLNRHWDSTLNSIKSQVLPAARQSDTPPKANRAPAPPSMPEPAFSDDVLDPDTYEKLLKRLRVDLRDQLPQPSTKLRHANHVRKELGISQTTLWRWSKQGLLKTVRICNSVYVDLDSLAEFESRARKGEFAQELHGIAATLRTRANQEA